MKHFAASLALLLFFLLVDSARAQFAPPQTGGELLKARQVPRAGQAESGIVVPLINAPNPSIEVQGVYQGSVAKGTVSAQPLSLTLADAIKRGLEYNLGTIGAGGAARQTRAQRLAAIAQLLPDLNGSVRETAQQINLAAQGLRISAPHRNRALQLFRCARDVL